MVLIVPNVAAESSASILPAEIVPTLPPTLTDALRRPDVMILDALPETHTLPPIAPARMMPTLPSTPIAPVQTPLTVTRPREPSICTSALRSPGRDPAAALPGAWLLPRLPVTRIDPIAGALI